MDQEKALRRGEWLTNLRPLELAIFLKWLLRVRRMEAETQGIKLWVDPASNFGKRVLRESNYEAELTLAFKKLLGAGQTFVDVGGNEGWFSMLAAKLVGPNGRVLTSEPQERLWAVILKNAALNGLTNIQLLPYAFGHQKARGEINLYPSVNTGSSHISGTKRRWEKKQSIQVIPLSHVLDGLEGKPVDLLKVDVEGFELQVLQGAGAHLGSSIRRLVVEIHPGPLRALGASEEQVKDLLRAKGYVQRMVEGVEVWELQEKEGKS
jgi:FkbM family methyltransferase